MSRRWRVEQPLRNDFVVAPLGNLWIVPDALANGLEILDENLRLYFFRNLGGSIIEVKLSLKRCTLERLNTT